MGKDRCQIEFTQTNFDTANERTMKIEQGLLGFLHQNFPVLSSLSLIGTENGGQNPHQEKAISGVCGGRSF